MTEPANQPARLRLRVTAAAEKAVRGGHPWVYSDSIREQNRDGVAGEIAVIYDRGDRFLALGLFDPESPLRLRVLHTGKPLTVDAAWWKSRLEVTLAIRAGLFDEHTTGYRLINGESDGWPGLVLDRYGEALVLKLYSAVWLGRVAELTALIQAALPAQNRLVLRLSRNIQLEAEHRFKLADGRNLFGDDSQTIVTFLETGLRFEADIVRGQKTGFFLDQRENRRAVESLSTGRDVLNAFSFSGGFSLYAARGGAKTVTDLDISPHAPESARRNFALNRESPALNRCRHEQIQADAFKWLAQKPTRPFGLVVLDPPSLAKRESERANAITAYRRANADAIRWLAPGGLLLSASCSAHVSREEFFSSVRAAARESGRTFSEVKTTGHAPDHPANFPEAEYLKAIYLRF